MARNETGKPATNVVTCFAPVGAFPRIGQSQLNHCPSLSPDARSQVENSHSSLLPVSG